MRPAPISDVMTSEPQTVERSSPLSDAYLILQHAPFKHLPVVEGDIPVGMVSAGDILKLVYDTQGASERTLITMLDHQFTIDDAMTAEPVSVRHDATVRDAAELLNDGTRHSVLIVDDAGDLVGIVTTTDLVQYLLWQFD